MAVYSHGAARRGHGFETGAINLNHRPGEYKSVLSEFAELPVVLSYPCVAAECGKKTTDINRML